MLDDELRATRAREAALTAENAELRRLLAEALLRLRRAKADPDALRAADHRAGPGVESIMRERPSTNPRRRD